MELVEFQDVMEEVVERGPLEVMVMVQLEHVCLMEVMESSPTSQAV